MYNLSSGFPEIIKSKSVILVLAIAYNYFFILFLFFFLFFFYNAHTYVEITTPLEFICFAIISFEYQLFPPSKGLINDESLNKFNTLSHVELGEYKI